jgi:DNA-binding NtrC family response regulator
MLPPQIGRSVPSATALPSVLPPLPPAPGSRTASEHDALKPLWQIEKEAIERTLIACEGSIPRAAAILEVAPSTLYRKKQAWDDHP